jgi:hypothetical protein
MADNPEYAGYLSQGFDKIEAVDDQTVKLSFTTHNILFLDAVAPRPTSTTESPQAAIASVLETAGVAGAE